MRPHFNEDYDEFPDDAEFVLTEWGCLSAVLSDYGIDFSHISGRVGQHIVEDFMEMMEKSGYIAKVNKDD